MRIRRAHRETRNETLSFDLDNSKSARVDIRMGAGELRVNSGLRS